MKHEQSQPTTEPVKLSPAEQKLLQRIQAQAPAMPSLVKFLSCTPRGFAW